MTYQPVMGPGHAFIVMVTGYHGTDTWCHKVRCGECGWEVLAPHREAAEEARAQHRKDTANKKKPERLVY